MGGICGQCGGRYRTTLGEHIVRDNGDGLRDIAVGVSCLLNSRLRVVHDGCYVVDVGDVSDIDLAHIVRTAAVSGDVNFSWGKREPADGWRAADAE